MDDTPTELPPALNGIMAEAAELGFRMSCELRTGSLLATLAASKPAGRLLEFGTGVGAGAAWLLYGMSRDAHLLSVEVDPTVQDVARRHLGYDTRAEFVTADGDAWLDTYTGPPFDLAYVDCRPGKYKRLDDLLALMRPGALYLGDDLLWQDTWPPDHQQRVDALLAALPEQRSLVATTMRWASGLVLAARI